jgi:hypothetical protein
MSSDVSDETKVKNDDAQGAESKRTGSFKSRLLPPKNGQ